MDLRGFSSFSTSTARSGCGINQVLWRKIIASAATESMLEFTLQGVTPQITRSTTMPPTDSCHSSAVQLVSFNFHQTDLL
jgi:hypothetical protein